MAAIAFDTLKFANRLKEAGFSQQQAEIITELQTETVTVLLEKARTDYHLDELATRKDSKETEVLLKRDIRETESRLMQGTKDLDLKIEQTRAELKQDIKDLDLKIEQIRADLTREIEFLRSDLKKDIEMLRLEMQKNMAEAGKHISDTKAELIRWVVGVGLLQSTLIIGVLMKISHLI